MQSTACLNQDKNSQTMQGDHAFAGLCLAVLVLSAGLADLAPIAFSVATVFLFAGPHNWVELRYFASRLPSRLGPLRAFFLSSFTGVVILGLSYAGLVLLTRAACFNIETATFVFQGWLLAFHAWIAGLALCRVKQAPLSKFSLLAGLSVSALLSFYNPLYFGLALVYLHPLVALAILDCELKRRHKAWQKQYRRILFLLPLALAFIVFQLAGAKNLPEDSLLNIQIVRHAGAFLLTGVSSHLLVSLHVFLETLHYAVWLLAIPIASSALRKQSWQPQNLPFARLSPARQKFLKLSFAISSLLVCVLWFAFAADYSATRDFYFTIAVFHILAEIPFLLWVL